jgi:hypothetical protein
MWSEKKIVDARQNPITFNRGAGRAPFDVQPPITLSVGTSSFPDVSCIVKTREGEQWLSVEPPETGGAAMRISAQFFDADGVPSLTIDQNDWIPSQDQWDTEVEYRTITVRRGHGERLSLVLTANPPHGITLNRLHMRKADLEIEIDPRGVVTISRGGASTRLSGCLFSNIDCAFKVL